MKTRRADRRYWTIALAVSAMLLVSAGVTYADITIASEITITGAPSNAQSGTPVPAQGTAQPGAVPAQGAAQPGAAAATSQAKPNPPQTATTYCKGRMARIERSDGQITIFDDKAGKLYLLHPDQKTYAVLSVSQMLEQPGPFSRQNAPADARRGSPRFDTDVKIEKSDVTKEIAGKNATRYVVMATMQASRPSRGMRGGGMGSGRGGFPGGRRGRFLRSGGAGDQTAGGESARTGPPPVHVQGEYWLVDARLLPGADSGALLPVLQQTVNVGPILKDLNDKLAKMKLFPVSSTTTVTSGTATAGPSTDTATPAPSDAAGSREPMVTAMEVKSVVEKALEDALFKVPGDYKEVKPTRDSAG